MKHDWRFFDSEGHDYIMYGCVTSALVNLLMDSIWLYTKATVISALTPLRRLETDNHPEYTDDTQSYNNDSSTLVAFLVVIH